ncbi:hypothetical protein AB8O55_24705 [Saccharopolyspora cebuensis]|uniref:Uncharacterized protein n=1 Tax=Saccharopolyspora cebuensis TaxID=418759 RepID=A0ABV4CND9_9PSEU
MIEMIPNRPLTKYISRAVETAEHAQEQLYLMRMHDAARLIHDVFPQAALITIGTHDRYAEPEGVLLHNLLDDHGQPLWTREQLFPDSLADWRTADGHSWGYVVSHLDDELTSALGSLPPQWFWEPVTTQDDSGLFLARLPSADQVAELNTITPGCLPARLHERNHQVPDCPATGPQLWLARPARYPTMSVGGADVTAFLADDGTLTVDVVTDATPAVNPGEGALAIDVQLNGTSLTASTG